MDKEKWQEVYTAEQLKKLQKIELMCLLDVHNVCESLGIHCSLYGGTLLGAFKYKGFIPWDDDVDLALLRKDYDKFLKLAPILLKDKYVVQNISSDSRCPYAYTKIRLKGTTYIEQYHNELDIEQGIYVDLYPIDEVPDDDFLRIKQYQRVQRLLKMFYLKQCLHISNLNRDNFIIALKSFIAFYALKFIPLKTLVTSIQHEMTKYNGTGCRRTSCLYYPKLDNYYNQYTPLKSVQFENYTFFAPCDIEEHLIRRYGDITKEPKSENRIGHYAYKVTFGKYENI